MQPIANTGQAPDLSTRLLPWGRWVRTMAFGPAQNTHLEVVQRLHLHDRAHCVERQRDLHSLVGAEWCVDLKGGGGGQAKAGEREAPTGMAGGAGADTVGSSGSGAGAAVGKEPLQQASLIPGPSS